MNALSRLVLSIAVCGCDQKTPKPEVVLTPPAAPGSAAATLPSVAPAAPGANGAPGANERRASGNGFTVALPPAWEPKTTDPKIFGAMRGQTATIQIMTPTTDADRAKYTAAVSDRAVCDAVFRSMAEEMHLAEFIAATPAGCERESSIAGMSIVAMIRVVEGRSILALCGGDGSERKVWEPGCRTIVASLHWEVGATVTPVRRAQVRSDVMPDGRTRVNADGLEVTLASGWPLGPDPGENKVTATRAKGLGVFTAGLFGTPMNITSAAECRERGSALAADSGGELTSSKFVRGQCWFAMTIGAQTTETVVTHGALGDTVWLNCVRGVRDVEAAAECTAMLASTIDRRAASQR